MKNPTQLLAAAMAYHQQGQWAEAEQSYLAVLKRDKRNGDALRLLGALYLQLGRTAQAIETMRQALQIQPRDAEILNNLALALRAAGKPDEAIKHFRQALSIQPHHVLALTNLGGTLQEQGQVDEAIDYYRKALAIKPDYPQAHFNLGNAWRARRQWAEAVACYEQALRLVPDYMDAAVNLGLTYAEMQRLDEAKSIYEKLLARDPNNIRALNNLGNIMREQRDVARAEALLRQAIQLKPDYSDAFVNLGNVYRDQGRTGEASECYERALEIKPDAADAMTNLGTLMLDAGQVEKSIALYDSALARKPDAEAARWGKSLCLLALGDLRNGWAMYEEGIGNRHARGLEPFKSKRWNGEPLAGKRLLIWSEQGLGDSLQFIRYADMCKTQGAVVNVLCPKPLLRLFGHLPSIDAAVETAREEDFDYHVAMMSLPYRFGTDEVAKIPGKVPYLFASPEVQQKWAPRFADERKYKVGLVWAGSPREQLINAHLIDKRRSMSLDLLRPLLDIKGARFYSLQIGKTAAQVQELGLTGCITDIMGDVIDFMDTAAIVENLDLVISVDTSVVHLVGGLGKPVWILSRFDACWRWLRNQETNPWYPTARVFGQSTPGDWGAVVEKIHAELENKVTYSIT
jgi:tetratricopeptide (TPR) repeat protein